MKKNYLSNSFLLILFFFHSYLILYGNYTIDIQYYIFRAANDQSFEFQLSFNYLIKLLCLFFEAETTITIIRFCILALFFTLAIKLQNNLSFLLLLNPIIIVGIHNSIRQSLALLLIIYAVFIFNKRYKTKFLIYLIAMFTHTSGLIGIILTSNYQRIVFKRFFFSNYTFFLFILILIFNFLFFQYQYELFSFFNKEDYIREQIFENQRQSSLLKGIYIFLLGLTPLLFDNKIEKRFLVRFLIFCEIGYLCILNTFTDSIFRLSYYLLIVDFILTIKNTYNFNKNQQRPVIFLHLVNTSGFVMISNII